MIRKVISVSIVLLFLLVLLETGVTQAGDFTLVEAVKLALENNKEINISQLDREIAGQNYETAKRSLLPELSLSSSYTRLSEAPAGMEIYNTKLSLQQPIYMGGKLRTGIKMADNSIVLADLQLKQKKAEIINRIIQSYYGILMAEDRVEIEKEALELVREHKRTVLLSIEVGMALQTDLLQVEIEEGNSRQSLQDAFNQLTLAKKSLGLMLGQDMVESNFYAPELVIELEPELEHLYQLALNNRTELKILKVNQEMTALNLDLKKKAKVPNLMMLGNYGWQGQELSFDNGSWDLTLSLSLSLFDGGKARSEEAKIKKDLEKIKNSQESLSEMIELELQGQLLDLQQNNNKIELQELNLQKAEENLRLSTMRFEAGLGTNIEVINARTMVKQARIMLMQAEYQYQMNLFNLLYKTGSLTEYFEGVINNEE